MCLPVRFRGGGSSAWAYGMTLNASRTGVLFRCGHRAHLPDVVELELLLPDGDGRICVRGVVTRVQQAADASRDQIVASTIDTHALARSDLAVSDDA